MRFAHQKIYGIGNSITLKEINTRNGKSFMCGIVGFTGTNQAAPILLDGLSKLEYRGYDSAGIAVRDGENPTVVIKEKGKLKALLEKTNNGKAVSGSCGIGHTRWATHGEPSVTNAHPHSSDDGNVVGVHNGIIENYQEQRKKLIKKGYTFTSQTDTEVAIKLIDPQQPDALYHAGGSRNPRSSVYIWQ